MMFRRSVLIAALLVTSVDLGRSETPGAANSGPTKSGGQKSVPGSNVRPSNEPAEKLNSLATFRDCPECPEMVVIPSGTFYMGSPEDEPDRGDGEMVSTEVEMPVRFAIGKFEVTFEEWDACVSAGGCSHKAADNSWGRGRRPVMDVSWGDALEYVAWLSKRTGETYRLPTDAEWEYAARAGETHAYMTGVRITLEQANHVGTVPEDPWFGQTRAVGSYPANAFGLYDVHGNVSEWTSRCFVQLGTGDRVCAPTPRGGSWYDYAFALRFAARGYQAADVRENTTGLRVVRKLDW